jgi:hypothetical protein
MVESNTLSEEKKALTWSACACSPSPIARSSVSVRARRIRIWISAANTIHTAARRSEDAHQSCAVKQDEKNICERNRMPDVTDILLCSGETTSNRSVGRPPKRALGLAIRMTPEKLHTDASSITVEVSSTHGMLTAYGYLLDREALLQKYRTGEASENWRDELQHHGVGK